MPCISHPRSQASMIRRYPFFALPAAYRRIYPNWLSIASLTNSQLEYDGIIDPVKDIRLSTINAVTFTAESRHHSGAREKAVELTSQSEVEVKKFIPQFLGRGFYPRTGHARLTSRAK